MSKVSVVIPVYNVEEYIGVCIESVLNQTLKDVEVICIDDASTDNSLSIVRKYAENDSRVKVIAYKENKSASQARKDGALCANGEYIMFMDGDDYLELDACEKLYAVIKEKDVDMVHFGTNVINVGGVSEKRIENLENMLVPYYDVLRDEEVFRGCFIEKKYRFSIWNKIYKNSLCKKAFEYVNDGNYPKAQDLYAFFILCYFAKSYYGIEEKFYNYRFGTGITGNKILNLSQLERYCHSVSVANSIEAFLINQKADEYMEIAMVLRKDLLGDCVGNWYNAVEDVNSAKGFDILCKYWNVEEVVSLLCERYYYDRKTLADKLYGAQVLKCKREKEAKTIGIFYHRISIGGVQRVISLLIPMYIELGYKVVLFTDEYSETDEYEVPSEVKRVVLPPSLVIRNTEYYQRAEEFSKYLKEYEVDIMCYQASSSPMLLFDMLLFKLSNIPTIVTVHEVAFQNMLTMNVEMVKRPSILRLADCITVLSRVEKEYWNALGINAVYIPNPITLSPIQRDLKEVEKNTIVWIGRLDTRTKRCLDVVDIMKCVVEQIPDAKLLVVGNEVSPGIQQQMQDKIQRLELENNVILCGHSTDVDSYYRRAEIHMLTSISESFSMTIVESKAYGLPLVLYELPFIELCRDKRGYISVPQGEKRKMADAIAAILKDDDLKNKLQKEAQESLVDFMQFDIRNSWNELFANIMHNEIEMSCDENEYILMQSLLQHYNYGATIINNEKAALQRRVDELQAKANELHKLKTTWDYKFGHFILYIPHQIIWRLRGIKEKIQRKLNK